jgi:hypothetical protein
MSKDKSDFCLDLKVIPQFSGTCWLNACLMSALYSQGSKYYVKKASKNWDKKNSLLMFFKTIIFKMKKHSKLIEKMYQKIKPEIILFKLIEQTKDKKLLDHFKEKIKYNNASFGFFESYIINLYKFLNVNVLDIYYFDDNKYYCNLHSAINYANLTINYANLNNDYIKSTIPDILVVYNYKCNSLLEFIKNYSLLNKHTIKDIIGINNYEEIVYYNNIKYKLDSVLIINSNGANIQKYHVITGITCNNNKYVYNGWSNQSNDPAIVKENNFQNGPCSLMKYNWDLKKNEKFCLNAKTCKLDFANIDKKDLCFSFNKGRRLLIYVRVDETKEKIESSKTQEINELSNIKDIIINIYDLENLSNNELKNLLLMLSSKYPPINLEYLNKSDNEIKLYLKEILVDYYYNFNLNKLDIYFKNIENLDIYIKNIEILDFNNLKKLFEILDNLYGGLDKSYIKTKKNLLIYLKKIIKEKYDSDSNSSIIVIPQKNKSKNSLVETKDKYTKKQCDDWNANKLVNPITGRKILQGKPVYNDFKKHCTVKSKSPIVEVKKDKVKSKSPLVETKGKYTKKQCDDWNANNLVNPITGRKIQEGKPVYNDLKKHCTVKSKSPVVIPKKDKSKSPLVETKGKYTKKQCDDWNANNLVNPITGRKIQEGKPVYNDLKKHCL